MHHSASRPNPAINATPRARLLVVDDEQLIRELYGRVLSLEGYEVETENDGVAGLERLAEEEFDLVLTDSKMPRLGGASVVLAMRSAGSRIPVIMISGSATPPAAIAREFSAILPKSARRAELVSAVARALRSAPPREHLHFHRTTDLAAA